MVFFKVEKIAGLLQFFCFVLSFFFAGEDISGVAYFNYVPTRELLVAGTKSSFAPLPRYLNYKNSVYKHTAFPCHFFEISTHNLE